MTKEMLSRQSSFISSKSVKCCFLWVPRVFVHLCPEVPPNHTCSSLRAEQMKALFPPAPESCLSTEDAQYTCIERHFLTLIRTDQGSPSAERGEEGRQLPEVCFIENKHKRIRPCGRVSGTCALWIGERTPFRDHCQPGEWIH